MDAAKRRRTTDISKAMSYLLRHGAIKERLPIRPDGFALLDDVLRNKTIARFAASRAEIIEMVESNDKQRYALKEIDGQLYIGANQGHSIQVENPDLRPIRIGEFPVVVHGTYFKHWDKIKNSGLNRMERLHIHFATGEVGRDEVISGMRSTCEILMYLDVEACLRDGIELLVSQNNVVLCAGENGSGVLPTRYFKYVLRARDRAPFDPEFPVAPPART